MPSDAYSSVVRGGLKLKGSAPAGVLKRKKKSKAKAEGEAGESKKDALQKALEDEDSAVGKELVKGKGKEEIDGEEDGDRELEERGNDGKTASERAYEEMRRKRVSFFSSLVRWCGG